MAERYGVDYIPSPWFLYREAWRDERYCQPDALLFPPGMRKVVICEVKYSHTPESFFQLSWRYEPVIRHLFPEHEVALCEIVRWYDPAVAFPCSTFLLREVHLADPRKFAVHILNG